MKKSFLALLLAMPVFVSAQFSIKGKVTSTQSVAAVRNASVYLENYFNNSITDSEGNYAIKNLKEGKYTLVVSLLGYEKMYREVEVNKDTELDIELNETSILTDEVIVVSIRNTDKSATAFTSINKAQLEKQNLGQDLPYLLNTLPSVTTTSDAGAGVGYTGMRIRGTDATRINVTINGVPVNDAESQGVYWVDLPDIASSLDNIQVQRGVGTSTNGGAAFGGSVNIQTDKLNPKPYTAINNSFGSFDTRKHTINFGTGLIDSSWAFDGRLSAIKSDGYMDRASADLKSYYLSGGYYGKSTIVKAIMFSGLEETYQAWYGVHKDSLKKNRTFNAAGLYYDDNGNIQYYDKQVDHYQQDYYQLHISRELNKNWNLNSAFHYTYGRGYYEEYAEDAMFNSYNLLDVIIGNDTLTSTDLIRRKWLDNNFYGTTFSANYNSNKKLTGSLGGAWNQYDGDHYNEIIWSKYSSNGNIRYRYFQDNALKTDFNIYGKAGYQLTENFNVFADLQYRTIGYRFLGQDKNMIPLNTDVDYKFFNPKGGITYDISENANIYVSYSVANKEPNRDDLIQSSPESRPKHETLNDIETGYRHKTQNAMWAVNVYYMDYNNQLVLTGEVNDVGEYNRTNIKDSYRSGVEAELGFKILKNLSGEFNATFSKNKVKNFKEFIDDYDMGGQKEIVYSESDIAFSPNIIASGILNYEPIKNLNIEFITKHVGKQYLGNTSNESRMLNVFTVNDLRLTYKIKTKGIKEIGFNIVLNNILDKKYESNGYTYGYIFGAEEIREVFYYPQAGRNFLAGLNLKF